MRNVVVCVVACCALKAVAVNAIGIVPIPSPIECKTDVTRPVALDETATVAVDCPDAAAAWGTDAKGSFRDALRTVDNDMKVSDYLDTGVLNWQVAPENMQ